MFILLTLLAAGPPSNRPHPVWFNDPLPHFVDEAPKPSTAITIDGHGRISVLVSGKSPANFASLKALEASRPRCSDFVEPVVFRAARQARYREFSGVMDRLQDCGIYDVRIITEFMDVWPLATTFVPIAQPPAKPGTRDKQQPEDIYVSISESGPYLGRTGSHPIFRPTSLKNLDIDIRSIPTTPTPKKRTIYIRGDSRVKYRQFLDLINQLTRTGYDHIALIAENLR